MTRKWSLTLQIVVRVYIYNAVYPLEPHHTRYKQENCILLTFYWKGCHLSYRMISIWLHSSHVQISVSGCWVDFSREVTWARTLGIYPFVVLFDSSCKYVLSNLFCSFSPNMTLVCSTCCCSFSSVPTVTCTWSMLKIKSNLISIEEYCKFVICVPSIYWKCWSLQDILLWH